MIALLNLLASLVLPGLLEWWIRWNPQVESSIESEEKVAKALAALAAILILGLGSVLLIGLSGRSVRRLLFRAKEGV